MAENIFSQVNEEGNRFMILDEIEDNCVGGTETTQQDKLNVSKNGGKIRRYNTKVW